MTNQVNNADKRTRILDTMLDLVSENGFHGTPMSMLAKRSGVSTGIIYHYFENKDALIHELYWEIKRVLLAALLVGDVENKAWPDNFEHLWINAFRFYVAHPRETRYLEQYENSPFADLDHEAKLADLNDPNYEILMRMMAQKVAEDGLRQMPLLVFYDLTFGVALSLAKRQIVGSITLDDEALKEVASICRKALEP